MIEIQNLKKSYAGTTVLDGINLTVNDGEIVGIVGRSGAGKTTLLRCLNGIEPFDSGSITIEGEAVNAHRSNLEQRKFKRSIGLVFQNFSLMKRRTVYENIALPMRLWKYDAREIDKTVRRLAKTVGLSEKLQCKPRELSGGQQQRVAIARALTLKPKTLLCDEATSALDPRTTDDILDLLRDINEESGIAVIMVTHQMEVVRRICQKVAVLDHGLIVSSGKTSDVFMRDADNLVDLLGDRQENGVLPTAGVNIRIIYGPEHVYDNFLSQMTSNLGVSYSIIWANTSKYRDEVLGSVIINVDDSTAKTIESYLDKNNVTWELA